MWSWTLYNEKGEVVHREEGLKTREEAALDYKSYRMTIDADPEEHPHRSEYDVVFD